MPTGYTAKVCDGTVTEFPDFALQCARAFGALVEMRDEPMDAEIPNEFKPSTYSANAYAAAKARLQHLRALTPDQAEVEALRDYEESLARINGYNEADRGQNERLAAMTAKVGAWMPPTPDHQELKRFMLEQLSISKNGYTHDLPVRLSGSAWLHAQIAKAQRDLDYHAEEQRKENERAAQRTAWVKALRLSLHTKAAE